MDLTMDLSKELLNPKMEYNGDSSTYDMLEFSCAFESRILNNWPVAKWPFGKPYEALVAFKLLTDVVMVVGWHEHTSDWNPELIFEMKEKVET